MMTDQEQHELSRLILELVDGYISDERLELLDRRLMESNEAMVFYCDHMKNAALLKRRIQLYLASASPCQDKRVWKALAISEKTAPGITLKRTKHHPDRFSDVVSDSTAKTSHISKLFLYSAILSTAAFMLILAYLNYWAPPATQSVATLVDSVDVRWALPSEAFNVGSRLKNRSHVLRLAEGVVKVAFDYGAEVIIEGPAEFEPASAEKMILHSGRVFARVPDYARGFTIQTPYSTVVDLGTEFGVYVAADRTAEVHMFQGKAMLVAGPAGASSRHQEIKAGQSRAVLQSGQIREIPTRKNAFIREIVSQNGVLWRGEHIDLADVLGGGRGFGDGLPNYSINPDTGQWQEGFHRREGLSTTAQCSYVVVEDLSLIDGVFVPDGRRSPVVVSSRGDVFEACPATDGRYYWSISNGFYIHDGHYRQTLGDVRYGTEDHPAISMHANSGITFDLDRMREELPAFELTAFRSLCGRTSINPVLETDEPVDFYVLVDGQVRFHYENATTQDDPRLVNVSLSDDDRFLTLVILSRTKLNSRRGLFALPEIVIDPRD